jgi:hypothetical protein
MNASKKIAREKQSCAKKKGWCQGQIPGVKRLPVSAQNTCHVSWHPQAGAGQSRANDSMAFRSNDETLTALEPPSQSARHFIRAFCGIYSDISIGVILE